MIIFIDESGDPGFKVAKGSSKSFVISLIIFNDEIDAEETALEIKKLKRDLVKSQDFEFKFNKCNKELRQIFLKAVQNCNFRIRSIVVQKEKIYSAFLRQSKAGFYNYVLKKVLENNNDSIKDAKIRLDSSGERLFRQSLTTYLRKNLNSKDKKTMKNIRFRDSKKDVLIQLADMIVGSIRKYYDDDTKDAKAYRKLIRKREEDCWEFK